ncbi:glycosyltransferase family 4 protein [Parasulfuritortus cantonensis]|uniref:Glycosyltransferase family 4 protein n=2 Tax=Parasulfuritortus cantonensis TaxID=2528202 RepID=A0A4R1BLI4_9PROT|nr:glycosyltransferase family 4 protein [Parasulfuritortus cantonensis]
MVSDVYFPRVNGVSTSIETFRQALAPAGVDIRLVAPRYGEEPDQHGIARIGARRIPRDPEDRLLPWRETRDTVHAEAAECDLVHIQTPFIAHYAGLRAARRLDKPVLATYHTFFEEYLFHYAPFLPPAWLKGLARRFSRTQCNDLDAVVVPSTAMRDRLADYGVRAPMHVLPTGIPLSRFAKGDRARFRADHGIPEGRPVVLFVGRVAHEKNIGFLIEVVARARRRLPELLFLVTGEGPAEKALRQRAAALGVAEQVRFLGYLDRQHQLPDAYAAADAFIFASRTETQGLVLLEAMAMGLPVVALAAMGTKDILAPGLGGVAAPDDVDGFAAALADLLEDDPKRARLAAEARSYARDWADDRMAGRLAELYRGLVS